MKWFLLIAACLCTALASAQSTLKIYVATDDARNDMDIIDINTSALSRYGTSVDSTNIQYYSNMMSTQVIRVDYHILFGVEEEPVVEMAEMTASMNEILFDQEPIVEEVIGEKVSEQENIQKATSPQSVSSSATASSSGSQSAKSKGKSKKLRGVKKKRHKKFNGKCPKFF